MQERAAEICNELCWVFSVQLRQKKRQDCMAIMQANCLAKRLHFPQSFLVFLYSGVPYYYIFRTEYPIFIRSVGQERIRIL